MGKSKVKDEIKSWGISLLIAFSIVLIVRSFIAAPYIVEGASMEPTLHNQEKIIVNKMGSFSRGDIVIIKGEDENYVKRIIGLPKDEIEMKNDQLYINGKLIDEPYLTYNREVAEMLGSKLTGDFGPITVPDNNYFVMGDNRLRSTDSRNGLGLILQENIIGKGKFVFYPFTEIRTVN